MYKNTTTNTKIDPWWLYIILEELKNDTLRMW